MDINPGPYWAIVDSKGFIVRTYGGKFEQSEAQGLFCMGPVEEWEDFHKQGYRCIRVTVEEVKERSEEYCEEPNTQTAKKYNCIVSPEGNAIFITDIAPGNYVVTVASVEEVKE